MIFDTWNIKGLYRAGLLMRFAKEISKQKLYLVEVQKDKCDSSGIEPFYRKGNEDHERIISKNKRLEFVNDRLSYIIMRGYWCDIVLNVQAPTGYKTNDMKDNFHE
jgi:hypothetical protein